MTDHRVIQEIPLDQITDKALLEAIAQAQAQKPAGHLRVGAIDYARILDHCMKTVPLGRSLLDVGTTLSDLQSVPVVLDFDMPRGRLDVAIPGADAEPSDH